MPMANFLVMTTKHNDILARARRRLSGNLGRGLAILVLIAAACGSAKAQYVGYAANSVDGTVSVFAVVTSGPTFGNEVAPGNQDHLIATVPVGANPVRIAVGPNLNKAYVTNRDNSLWVIDVTKISQEAISPGSVTATNINPNNVFNLSTPFGIAIASVTQGVNKGRVLAFIVNQGNNTVTVLDTSNNSLVTTIHLGGTGAPVFPEVAATPDGNQVFVISISQVFMIDPTSVASGSSATIVPVTGPVGSAAGALSIPRGISTTQYTDGLNQLHTLVLVSDSVTRQGGNGYVYVLDRVAGETVSTTPIVIPNSSSLGDVATLNLTRAIGTPIDAEVLDQSGSTISFIQNINTLTPSVFSTISLNSAADRLAVTPDTGFTYITEGFSGQKGQVQLVDNLSFGAEIGAQFCLADGSSCSNNTSVAVGTETTGIAISSLDPSSPAVVWFIPPVSGGFPPPSAPLALGPNGATLAVSGESMVGNVSQPIQTILGFGTGNSCAIFSTSLGSSGTPIPDDCTANPTGGGNGIGGTGTFPASGVFTISLGTTANGGSATETVTVGANCTVSSANVMPTTNVAVGQTVKANISCTAPVNDQLAGNVNWGDGKFTVSAQPVPANGSTPVFLPFTHQYATPSTPGGYPLTVSVTDNTSGAAASVTGGPVTVTVVPISVQITSPATPVSVQAAHTQNYTAAVSFDITNSGVNWTLSGTGCTLAACGTLSNTTSTATTYTAPAAVPNPATVTITATSIADKTKFASQTITITALTPPACTLTAPALGQANTSVTATLSSCTAQPGDSVTATIIWGDKTPNSTSGPVTANGNGVVTFSPSSFTHTYATAGTFSISAQLQDNTVTGITGTGGTNTIGVISVQPPASGPTSITIGPGQSAMFTMNFTGIPKGVMLAISCAVTPNNAAKPNCAVSPSTLTGNGGIQPQPVQVTITSVGAGTSLSIPQNGRQQYLLFASLLSLPCLGFVFLGMGFSKCKARNRAPWGLLLLIFTVALLLSTGACSSIQRSDITCTSCTTAGNYTVTVTATSTSPVFQASGAFTVVVAQ